MRLVSVPDDGTGTVTWTVSTDTDIVLHAVSGVATIPSTAIQWRVDLVVQDATGETVQIVTLPLTLT